MYNTKAYSEKNITYYANQRPEMAEYIPSKATNILEIGCGKGEFGKLMKAQRSCEYTAFEPDPKSAEIASEYLDTVYSRTFDPRLLESKKFDCIIFNDVLEHLDYPELALQNCKELLNVDGVIVASIPNFRFYSALQEVLFNKDFPSHDSGIFDKTHLRFFTKASIERLFTTSGFQICALEGINRQEIRSKKFKILKRLFPGIFDDIEYLQYAIVARNGK